LSYSYSCYNSHVTADFQMCIEGGTVSQIARQRTLSATAALTLHDTHCNPEALFQDLCRHEIRGWWWWWWWVFWRLPFNLTSIHA